MSKYNHIDYLIDKEHKVLNEGFVKVVDYMGSDKSVVKAARVSYDANNKPHTQEENAKLINYLMKHKHSSPFEMCEIELHIKAPIFVARQWMRHRMASYNEISARYTEVKDSFYIPNANRLAKQSKTNKQCSSQELLDTIHADEFLNIVEIRNQHFIEEYNYFNSKEVDLAKEINRINMPVSAYTEFYYKTNLKNLLHFIKLRDHPHAQKEIQEYARVIDGIIQQWCPVVYQAFIEHDKEAATFSKTQVEAIPQIIENKYKGDAKDYNLSKRDFQEICNLFQKSYAK
jgi:thymidylate synthase (FAD)